VFYVFVLWVLSGDKEVAEKLYSSLHGLCKVIEVNDTFLKVKF
jgi:hypothetical protein